jgi:chaperonin GroES
LIITPLFDRVLVRKEEFIDPNAEKPTIEEPDQAKEEPVTGIVVACGEGRILPDGTLRPLSVKVGDFVLFGRYSGEDLNWRLLKGHALIREDEVLAKLG